MKRFIETQELRALAAEKPWHFAIGAEWGVPSIPDDCFGTSKPILLSINPTVPTGSGRYLLSVSTDQAGGKELSWRDLPGAFRAIGVSVTSRILLDLTALRVDNLLYTVRALHQIGVEDVELLYRVPRSYGDAPAIEVFSDLRQPKGFVNFVTPNAVRMHLLLLGFDHLRADRVIHLYDWKLEDCFFAIGKPSTVAGGEARAMQALSSDVQKFIARNSDHRFDIDASDVGEAYDLISAMRLRFDGLDVVPMGPKPWTFAAAMHVLESESQSMSQFRLLYDYAHRASPNRIFDRAVIQSWRLQWLAK